MSTTNYGRKDKARERRRDKRIIDAGLGRKKTSDVLLEEATEEAFDWLEQGGARRLWVLLKVIASIVFTLVVITLVYIFGLLG